MAKKKSKKSKTRRNGPKLSLPKVASMYARRALTAVRMAKVKVETSKGSSRKVWRELHNVESRLSRMA